jgi:hypothetical protein
MNRYFVFGSIIVLMIVSSSSGLTPIKDDCRSYLLDNVYPHYYSISPSSQWVFEIYEFPNNSTGSDRSDSVQLFLFPYCSPSQRTYLTTIYASSSQGTIVNFLADGIGGINQGDSWGAKGICGKDTVYFQVWGSTLNSSGHLHGEIFKMCVSSITAAPTGAAKQSFIPQLAKISNYPNPFKRALTIEYSIPTDEYVAINIYKVKGELIRVLGQNKQIQGTHSILWDGKDNHGNQIASGTYYYQIISGNFISIKTIVKIE